MTKPIEVSEATFEELVIKADKPTLVDFWAVWCGPCKMIAPVLEEIAAENAEQLQVAKRAVDHNGQLAMQYGVMSIPTLLLFKGGEAVERLVGFMPKDKLMDKLRAHL
jgi:thioredoxin 1